jgi:hypothetical protein
LPLFSFHFRPARLTAIDAMHASTSEVNGFCRTECVDAAHSYLPVFLVVIFVLVIDVAARP